MSVYYNGKEIPEIAYSDDTGKLSFKNMGYEDVPEQFQKGYEYAKEIYDNWDSSVSSLNNRFEDDKNLLFMPKVDTSNVTSMRYCFSGCYFLTTIPELDTGKVTNMGNCFNGCKSLTTIPELDTSNVTNMRYCFSGCSNLTEIPQLDTGKVNDMLQCFQNCSNLTTIPKLDTGKVINMNRCFGDCKSLTTIPELDTSNVTDMGFCFYNCSKLKRIEGLSFKSMGSISSYSYFFFGYIYGSTCRYILIKDIGTNPDCTILDTTYASVWGIADTEITDARQSLIDSLLTYSFDRRAAGYSDCTIKLYSNVKAVLTEDEINSIQAKGYIIS